MMNSEFKTISYLGAEMLAADARGDETAHELAEALLTMYDHGLIKSDETDENGEPLFSLNEFASEEDWEAAFEDFNSEHPTLELSEPVIDCMPFELLVKWSDDEEVN